MFAIFWPPPNFSRALLHPQRIKYSIWGIRCHVKKKKTPVHVVGPVANVTKRDQVFGEHHTRSHQILGQISLLSYPIFVRLRIWGQNSINSIGVDSARAHAKHSKIGRFQTRCRRVRSRIEVAGEFTVLIIVQRLGTYQIYINWLKENAEKRWLLWHRLHANTGIHSGSERRHVCNIDLLRMRTTNMRELLGLWGHLLTRSKFAQYEKTTSDDVRHRGPIWKKWGCMCKNSKTTMQIFNTSCTWYGLHLGSLASRIATHACRMLTFL